MILLVAVGNGSSQAVQNAISSLGTNSLTVLHTDGSAGSAAAPTSASGSTAFAEPQNLTVPDAQALAQAQGVTQRVAGGLHLGDADLRRRPATQA